MYALLLGWPALASLHKGLFYLSGRALGLFNYISPRISGESHVIRTCLADKKSPVVFDVGANEGQWTADVMALEPTARVHAFEPQSRLANRIAAEQPGVKVNNMALGDAPGTLELGDYAEHAGSQHASLLKGVIDGIHHGAVTYTSVAVGTLDDYCTEHGIDHIDLLKIDVEGFELKVLQGAKRMLAERRLDVIQFEFNEMNVIGGTFLNDFFVSLNDTHLLFRLLPHGLLPLKAGNHWLNEQFVFQNIIAFRR
ncbi:FkbM family methyltransferase [Piscinibacter gummiphilus]|uniref:FkbM family methyltransferase n=1 Tax=Piscinibacter gummiphilus TaxID=946333 RepID=UPI000A268E50|nr:FkbM family methyltransferase [Piscinibacter gummiphilus]ATU67334.1 FkbM family methyltransferase [Piscinibacter gummiphilus]GLS97678.1 methyltransferase FkbM [Piscinibacter gummiphilus]